LPQKIGTALQGVGCVDGELLCERQRDRFQQPDIPIGDEDPHGGGLCAGRGQERETGIADNECFAKAVANR
jgi:hypothetical protein